MAYREVTVIIWLYDPVTYDCVTLGRMIVCPCDHLIVCPCDHLIVCPCDLWLCDPVTYDCMPLWPMIVWPCDLWLYDHETLWLHNPVTYDCMTLWPVIVWPWDSVTAWPCDRWLCETVPYDQSPRFLTTQNTSAEDGFLFFRAAARGFPPCDAPNIDTAPAGIYKCKGR